MRILLVFDSPQSYLLKGGIMETIIRTNYLFDGIHPVQKGHIVIKDDKISAKEFNIIIALL